MREIKFRGCDKIGNWHYGNLIYGKNGICYISVINNNPISKNGEYWYIDTPCFEVIPEYVGEFTGLHDENGVEIYEGDIISDNVGIGVVEYVDKKGSFRVNYKNGKCKWFIDFLESEINTLEIIGNLYEHPHLINS